MKHLERVCIDMSGMHLLPIYYTTTNHKSRKKSRKLTKRMDEALSKHEKFLKKMGVSSNPIVREPSPLKLDEPKNRSTYESIGDGVGNGFVKTRHTLSGDYIVGQAYNKGNLQVLSKTDSADASTGKRR